MAQIVNRADGMYFDEHDDQLLTFIHWLEFLGVIKKVNCADRMSFEEYDNQL